jgi:hypothetical protein
MVKAKYANPKTPTATEITMATVLKIVKKNTTRPMKNRNTERWRSVGAVFTARCMRYFSTPKNRKERTRARSFGTFGI